MSQSRVSVYASSISAARPCVSRTGSGTRPFVATGGRGIRRTCRTPSGPWCEIWCRHRCRRGWKAAADSRKSTATARCTTPCYLVDNGVKSRSMPGGFPERDRVYAFACG